MFKKVKFNCSWKKPSTSRKHSDNMNKHDIYKQLKIDEGVKYEIYEDHLGYLTFGVGHLVKKTDSEYGLPVGTPVSSSRVQEVFYEDLETAIWDCDMLYGPTRFRTWPSEVQEILVNMVFNLGRPRLSKFVNFKKALEAKDWKLAAKEGRDSLWYHQVKNRAERLMSRLENIS